MLVKAGSRELEAGSRKWEVGSWEQEAWSRKLDAGSGKLGVMKYYLVFKKCSLPLPFTFKK
ncbi:hypothetical protein ACFQO1_11420 [Jejudonia soesokkakensis]|uniref:Uncharacterized protein n=1 Tax=Jejudonia soesokkakensis TaxID=1323432 RepID=A0ABW2MX37_9FLAO